MNSPYSLFDLTNRRAVITGGAGTLGGAISVAFAQAGAEVIVVDINLERAESIANTITNNAGKSHAFAADLSNEKDVMDLFAKIDAIGEIDILVNAVAALGKRYTPDQFPLEEWEETITSDLTSFFLTSREAAQRMIKTGRGGSIVNFGSIAGASVLGRGGMAYGVAKAGVSQLTKECAIAWAHHKIRVNAILPAQFVNRWWDETMHDPKHRELVERVVSGIPLGRMGNAEEIVGPALFLASDASSMVTGVCLPVDGGNLALNPGGTINVV
jgi:NAD(P)-dependent dehydrogenase (short-subunit alcohol dehydrogenase family)